MNLKDFFERLIRGWLPEEPKMPKKLMKNLRMPVAAHLRFTNSLKIVYCLTLGFVTLSLLAWLIVYCWKDQSSSIFFLYRSQLPILFLINTIPLAIFATVFLTKGNGLNYFRKWNAGKKLQFSGLAIVVGYVSVLLPYILRVSPFFIEFEPYGPFSMVENPQFSLFVYFGLSLMAIGFASLLLIYKTSASSGEATDAQKTKIRKRTVVLVFVIAVLTVSLVCLAGLHYKLQIDYDHFREGFDYMKLNNIRLVNEQWTDNTGIDSKYVNFKVGVLNIGYGKSYNVTVIVLVHGQNNTLLEREEIFVGDLDIFEYQEFDVNIEYSGKLAYVSSGYSWD